MTARVITVFGGSGFVGRHVVRRLVASGATVRVAVRDVEGAAFLKPLGKVGQILPVWADVGDAASVARALDGAEGAVNLVGLLAEFGRQNFSRVHVEGAKNVAQAAAAAGVSRLVQVSAIGADSQSTAAYARTKGEAEQLVQQTFAHATILRPSVVFGAEDNFFNQFALMSRFSVALPVIGCPPLPKITLLPDADRLIDIDFYGDGGAKFQPVYVGDVADAVVKALEDPDCAGKTYELGGPRVLTFMGVMKTVLAATGHKRLLVPVSYGVAKVLGWVLGWAPKPLLTAGQVEMLKTPNVVHDGMPGLAELGITATSIETVVPRALARFRGPNAHRRGLA